MLTDEIFVKGMYRLAAAYPEFLLTEPTIEVYRDNLSNLSVQEFEQAISHHIRTAKWFPKISELLGAVAQVSFPKPIEVWNHLIEAAEKARPGERPLLDMATERALRAIGGWEKFQLTPYDELKWLFKEFKEVYLAVQEQESGRPEIEHKPVPQVEGPE